MKCSRVYIAFALSLLLFSSTAKAQDTRFDAMMNEKLMAFTQRDFWQKPDTLIALMAIEPAEHIAEIGAGEGYFSVKLAGQVGPDGKLYALDTDDAELNVLKLIRRYSKLFQIELVQHQPNQLGLEASSLDKVVMFDTYHELENYQDILKQCFAALKPGGKVIIIDRYEAKMDNDKASRKKLFKKQNIRPVMVASDLEEAGFSIDQTFDKYTLEPGKVHWFYMAAIKE